MRDKNSQVVDPLSDILSKGATGAAPRTIFPLYLIIGGVPSTPCWFEGAP